MLKSKGSSYLIVKFLVIYFKTGFKILEPIIKISVKVAEITLGGIKANVCLWGEDVLYNMAKLNLTRNGCLSLDAGSEYGYETC